MRIEHIIWLPEIEDKLLRKHGVQVEEAEDVLFGSPHIRFVEKGQREGEDLYAGYGQTEAGRWLIVFFVMKSQRRALIVSARDMERKERRLYARR